MPREDQDQDQDVPIRMEDFPSIDMNNDDVITRAELAAFIAQKRANKERRRPIRASLGSPEPVPVHAALAWDVPFGDGPPTTPIEVIMKPPKS